MFIGTTNAQNHVIYNPNSQSGINSENYPGSKRVTATGFTLSATEASPVDRSKKITFVSSKNDSLLYVANSLLEVDYTVPSWTLLRRSVTTASILKDSVSTTDLQNTIANLKGKDMPYNINTTLNKDPKTMLGFAWFTNVGVTGGKVEIMTGTVTDYAAFNTPDFTFDAKCDSVKNLNYSTSVNYLANLAGIPDNTKKSYTKNKVLATGLTPNTTYSYRVGKAGSWSDIGTFTTASNTVDPFSFIYISDFQVSNDTVLNVSQKTTHTAQYMYPNANFWLNAGNLAISTGTNNSEWEYEQFFQTQQDILLKKPLAPVLGNHDVSKNQNFTQHFNTDSIGFDYAKSTVPGSIYSFVYGDALFMGLNLENYNTPGYLDSISNWMRRQVAKSPDPKWRIVFFHTNIYTGAQHQPDDDGIVLRQVIAPVLDELKIDLALQGHDHIYEVIGPVFNKQLVANAVTNQISVTFDKWMNVTGKSGGTFNVQNGTLYFLNGRAGSLEYAPKSQDEMTSIESGLDMTNYFGLFNGRFGQTYYPTFSHITVSTDEIDVNTYAVRKLNEITLYDSFKMIKFKDVVSNLDNATSGKPEAISVYPVPVKDYVYIKLINPVKSKVEVFSSKGTLVKTEQINGSTGINLQDLAKDVYILKVVSGADIYKVKFVKE